MDAVVKPRQKARALSVGKTCKAVFWTPKIKGLKSTKNKQKNFLGNIKVVGEQMGKKKKKCNG